MSPLFEDLHSVIQFYIFAVQRGRAIRSSPVIFLPPLAAGRDSVYSFYSVYGLYGLYSLYSLYSFYSVYGLYSLCLACLTSLTSPTSPTSPKKSDRVRPATFFQSVTAALFLIVN